MAVVLLLLVALRAALPFGVQWYVNRQLDNKEGYFGHIGDVDIHLWRGAYEIENVEIYKSNGKVPVPFFAARKVDLSIQWSELWQGALVGEVQFDRARMNFVAGPTPEESQTEVDREWGDVLDALFPFQINRFAVRRSQVHFQRLHSNPPVDVYLNEVNLVATNLTNARDLTTNLVAGIEGTAVVQDGGSARLSAALDPFGKAPTFDLNLEIKNLNLVHVNSFLKEYGKFDVERGTFHLALEVAAARGRFEGYLKPVFDDLDVLNFKEERKGEKLTQNFWEALVGATAQILENKGEDRLAAVIPFSGSLDKPDVHLLATVGSVLKNGFIRALLPGVEGTVELDPSPTGKPDPKRK